MDVTKSTCGACGANFRKDGTCPDCVSAPEASELREVRERLARRKTRVVEQLTDGGKDKDAEFFAIILVETAAEFFALSPSMADDFGLQSGDLYGGVVVFGGTNRLKWSLKHGFVADVSYCTERFLSRYKLLMH